MCKESEPNLDDLAMLTLSYAILLMRVRAGNMVCDADLSKERMEFLILTPQSVCIVMIFQLKRRLSGTIIRGTLKAPNSQLVTPISIKLQRPDGCD
jgi:hypothetical protein